MLLRTTQAHDFFLSRPYPIFFPTIGFATCWIDLPFNSRNDAQHSASYVAYHIQQLAPLSATGKIVVVGHSQGAGLNIQWALLYWTSTRALVSRYIALAGDFHGTSEGPLFCAVRRRGSVLQCIIPLTLLLAISAVRIRMRSFSHTTICMEPLY